MKPEYPTSDQEGQLRRLWKLVFGDPESFIACFFSTAYSPDHCRGITLEGQAAAALYWLDAQYRGQKLAYIYAVATHPDHRGRGLCRRLMADTHRILSEQGYAAAMLTPAEPGLRRMYAGMGYRDCCSVSEFTCGSGEPISLRQVDGAEYGRLRRRWLPETGVLQEGRNLSFLEGCCRLLAGNSFLCAASVEEGQLRAMELLGDPQTAPGILGALGCREGTFRTPGTQLPFSMFCPLTGEAEAPGYFGLAFD